MNLEVALGRILNCQIDPEYQLKAIRLLHAGFRPEKIVSDISNIAKAKEMYETEICQFEIVWHAWHSAVVDAAKERQRQALEKIKKGRTD